MLLELENVTKRFGGKTTKAALDDVSFAVGEGEVVALAGPNGAGKTTAMRLLMGFIAVDRGVARLFGDDARKRRWLDRVGWMPERPTFPPDWRSSEVLRFQAKTFPSWDEAFAAELTERLALDLSARARQLSRGQTARLALVLALAHRPSLLLLDDPASVSTPPAAACSWASCSASPPKTAAASCCRLTCSTRPRRRSIGCYCWTPAV